MAAEVTGALAGFAATLSDDQARLFTAIAIISPIGGIGDRVSPSEHECIVLPADVRILQDPRRIRIVVKDGKVELQR